MLKRRDSAYQAGRVKGQWYKWKRAALTLDCVLMYAQRSSGKRSSFYSDYTFGAWRSNDAGGQDLVPVGKAYSGFTDDELRLIDTWIRANTTETFGRCVPSHRASCSKSRSTRSRNQHATSPASPCDFPAFIVSAGTNPPPRPIRLKRYKHSSVKARRAMF